MDYNKTSTYVVYTSGTSAQRATFTYPNPFMIKKIWCVPLSVSSADFVITLGGFNGAGVWYTLPVGAAAASTNPPTPYIVGSIPEVDRTRPANQLVEVRVAGTSGGVYMIGLIIAHQE